MKYDITALPQDRVLVSPSLLAADFWNLENEITNVTAAKAAGRGLGCGHAPLVCHTKTLFCHGC